MISKVVIVTMHSIWIKVFGLLEFFVELGIRLRLKKYEYSISH